MSDNLAAFNFLAGSGAHTCVPSALPCPARPQDMAVVRSVRDAHCSTSQHVTVAGCPYWSPVCVMLL